jgi:dTDP-4-dehydrorhamnose 3,5-epimerase
MIINNTNIEQVRLIEPEVFEDNRGWFIESYNRRILGSSGIHHRFVQDNHSFSHGGVLRGMHYQVRDEQAKLIRVVSGEIYDVAVDIRQGSPSFGQWIGFNLSASNRKMLFIPEGFAHGFLTISQSADVLYKCSDYYNPEMERGIAWNDPGIGIEWPNCGGEPVVSNKDRTLGTLAEILPDDLPRYTPDPDSSRV